MAANTAMPTPIALHTPVVRRRVVIGAGATLIALAVGGRTIAISRTDAMHEYDGTERLTRRLLAANPAMVEFVRYATLAPSGHNTQPWRFRPRDDGVDIVPDVTRRTPVVDPDDHHLFIGLGAAAENLALAATMSGAAGEWRFDPAMAAIAFRYTPGRGAEPALFAAIPRRRSARTNYDGRPITLADRTALVEAARTPGVDVVLLDEASTLSTVRDLVLAGNSTQVADPGFVRELKSWIRFNPRAALNAGDGLFTVASGSPALPDWLGSTLFDRTFTAASENDRYARQLRSTPLIAVFSGEEANAAHWTEVGRAAQRFALQATALGLAHAFMNQPVEVAAFRADLASLAGLPGRRPDLLMRVGHGPTLPFSPRRPVAAVLV